ncbi:MAG: tyrosine-type recombinase/integrase, partial [bacterium]
RERITVTFKDREMAENRLIELNDRYVRRGQPKPSNKPLQEFMEKWINHKTGSVKETTLELYRSHLRNHIKTTFIGDMPLQELNYDPICEHFDKLKSGNYDHVKDDGLSGSFLQDHYGILNQTMKWACKRGKLHSNPIMDFDVPKRQRDQRDITVIDESQISTFLETVRDQNIKLYPLFLLMANTGMRKSEICGLRWKDVDLGSNKILVRKQLNKSPYLGLKFLNVKSDSSNRTIKICDFVKSELLKHKNRQEEWRDNVGDEAWFDHEIADGINLRHNQFVFTDRTGKPIRPDHVYKKCKDFNAETNLPEISPHTFRHSHASILLQQGHSPNTVQERLGHYSAETTMDLYGHLLEGMDQEAANSFGQAIQSELDNADVA